MDVQIGATRRLVVSSDETGACHASFRLPRLPLTGCGGESQPHEEETQGREKPTDRDQTLLQNQESSAHSRVAREEEKERQPEGGRKKVEFEEYFTVGCGDEGAVARPRSAK